MPPFPNRPHYLLPSTIITWYPCPVFTSTNFGFAVVLGSSSYAAFSNAASREPLTFQPRLPPCRALSSENSRATSSNFAPSRNFVTASSFLECFSHWIRFSKRTSLLIARWRKNEKKKDNSMRGLLGAIDWLINREEGRKMGRHTRICRALMAVAGLSFELLLASLVFSSFLLLLPLLPEPLPLVVFLSLLLLGFSAVLVLPAIVSLITGTWW